MSSLGFHSLLLNLLYLPHQGGEFSERHQARFRVIGAERYDLLVDLRDQLHVLLHANSHRQHILFWYVANLASIKERKHNLENGQIVLNIFEARPLQR